MEGKRPGRLSALVALLLAPACCALPLLGLLLALGGVRLASFLGRGGPWFDLALLLVVAGAWLYFLRHRHRAHLPFHLMTRDERRTMAALSLASLLAALFAGPALLSRLPDSASAPDVTATQTRTQEPVRGLPEGAPAYLRKMLRVEGMSRAACVPQIKHSLARVAGVHSVDVSLGRQTVTVEYDPAKTSPGRLVNAVRAAGYDAKVVN